MTNQILNHLLFLVLVIYTVILQAKIQNLEKSNKISYGLSFLIYVILGGLIGFMNGILNLPFIYLVPYWILTFPPILTSIGKFIFRK